MTHKRTAFGIVVTVLWIALSAAVAADIGLAGAGVDEIGRFLGGVATPIAFLWLVIGYFQHGEELREHRRELETQRSELARQRDAHRRQADAAAAEIEIVRQSEQQARKEMYLHVQGILEQQQTYLASRMIEAVRAYPSGTWEAVADGDRNSMFRAAIKTLCLEPARFLANLRPGSAHGRVVDDFVANAEWLLSQAELAGPELREAMERQAMIDLYLALCSAFRLEPKTRHRARVSSPTELA